MATKTKSEKKSEKTNDLLPDVEQQRNIVQQDLDQKKTKYFAFNMDLMKLEARRKASSDKGKVWLETGQGAQRVDYKERKRVIEELMDATRAEIEELQKFLDELPKPEKKEEEEL